MGFGGRPRQRSGQSESLFARLLRNIRNAFAALALAFLLATFTPLTVWWAALLQGGEPDPKTGKVMVVLASSGLEELLGDGSYRRSVFAVREARRGGYERIIISGGGSGEEPSVNPMKAFMMAAGVDGRVIELESKSKSTRENAQFTAKLLRGEKRSVALVTSDFHMFRSARLFHAEGISVLRRPYPDVSARAWRWRDRWQLACELAVETVKITYYKLRWWI